MGQTGGGDVGPDGGSAAGSRGVRRHWGGDKDDEEEGHYLYSAKFVCSATPLPNPYDPGGSINVTPAFAWTTINVHNFQGIDVTVQKKAVLGRLEDAFPQSRISQYRRTALKPDEAFFTDCTEIQKMLDLLGTTAPTGSPDVSGEHFYDGFVVFYPPRKVDVVAVYDKSGGAAVARPRPGPLPAGDPIIGGGVSIDVEYIQPRRLSKAPV